jgi:hypothetical protein
MLFLAVCENTKRPKAYTQIKYLYTSRFQAENETNLKTLPNFKICDLVLDCISFNQQPCKNLPSQ